MKFEYCIIFNVICQIILLLYLANISNKREYFASCAEPDNAKEFNDGDDDDMNVLTSLAYSDNVCLASQLSSNHMSDINARLAVTTVQTPIDSSGSFGYMDSQYTSCDNVPGAMTGWSVNIEDDSYVQTKGLCQVLPDRLGDTYTSRTNFAPIIAGMLPHSIDCGEAPLVGIGFEKSNNGREIRCRYDCANDVVTDKSQRQTYYTGWNAAGNISMGESIRSTLDDQTVQCPAGTVLTSLKSLSCTLDNTRTLLYTCDPVDFETTLQKSALLKNRPRRTADVVYGKTYFESDLLDKQLETVFDKLDRVVKPLRTASGAALRKTKRAAESTDKAFTKGQHVLSSTGDKARTKMSYAGEVVGGGVGKGIRGVGKGFRKIGMVGEKLRDGVAMAGSETIEFVGRGVLHPITGTISTVGNGIADTFEKIGDAFPGDKLKEDIGSAGTTLARGTTCKVSVPVKKIGDFIMPGFKAIKKGFDKVRKALKKIKINI